MQAINHDAVAIHQSRPAVSALQQEHHAPVPAVIKGDVEVCTGPLEERARGRGDEGDKAHPHLVVVTLERPAVDKLLAEKVLVSDIKAVEDVNLRSCTSSSTALWPARCCTRLIGLQT